MRLLAKAKGPVKSAYFERKVRMYKTQSALPQWSGRCLGGLQALGKYISVSHYR